MPKRYSKRPNGVGTRPSREYNSKYRDWKRAQLAREEKELDAMAARYNVGDMIDDGYEIGEVIEVADTNYLLGDRSGRQTLLVEFDDGRKEFISNDNVTRAP